MTREEKDEKERQKKEEQVSIIHDKKKQAHSLKHMLLLLF